MNHVGIDLHKKTIVLCVLDHHRTVRQRGTSTCCDTEGILELIRRLSTIRAVFEATASFEWLVALVESLAE